MRRISPAQLALKVGIVLVYLTLGVLVPGDHLRLYLTMGGEYRSTPHGVGKILSVSALTRMSRWGLTPWVRHEATWRLGRMPDEAAKAALRERIAETSDPTLWGLAVRGGYHTDREALAAARPEMIVTAFDSENRYARASAVFGARALGDPSNAPRCIEALDDDEHLVRMHAMDCVVHFGVERQLDALQEVAARSRSKVVLNELAELALHIDDPKAEALFMTAARTSGPKTKQFEALARGSAPWCTRRLQEIAAMGDPNVARLLAERSLSAQPATGPSAPAADAPPPGQSGRSAPSPPPAAEASGR